jgi:D-glycero-D-manno-heptose 1,7-bisphosphate phosphatase
MTLVDSIGLWCHVSTGDFAGRAALFLDRDGVVVEEVDYLGRPDDVHVIPGAAEAIARCNRAGLAVVLVTNQSGIGRGYYDWNGFHAVQERISEIIAAAQARLDAVLACAYHATALGAYRVADHPWRKPKPGMIVEAGRLMAIDLSRSWIVGDRAGDIEAARAAALAGGTIVETGYGPNDIAAALELASARFAVESAANIAEAVDNLFARGHCADQTRAAK